uniref:Uncharacterized protein n=1 Tax=viral metagenome TaxID=1070528 RepID=A0A6M3LUX7_9ZZZZ
MRPENKRMQEFLRGNGINAVPWYIFKGSMKRTWRLYGKNGKGSDLSNYQKWTPDLAEKLNGLGFRDYDGKPLGLYSGNGGVFCIFVRGHYDFLEGGK